MRFGKLVAVVLFSILPALPYGTGVLQIDFDEAHPPYMYEKDGAAAGAYPALIKAAFIHMNVPVRFEPKPWARALHEIDIATAGVGGIYKNQERLKQFDYSEPLLVETITVYFRKDHPINYSRIDDLKGKRVGVMLGWSYGDEFDKARKAGLFTAEGVGSDAQNFQKLEGHRVDVVLAIGESVSVLLEVYPDVRYSDMPLIQTPTYLAFAKSTNRLDLLKRFDQTIKAMKASGEFKKILAAEFAK
jgi:polar amino acid transport system substrate-binding protein